MTGYPDDNRAAFRAATKFLREVHGYQVISPDELDSISPAAHHTWEDYLRRDLGWVARAEVCICLPGWRQSRGASLEVAVMSALGCPVFELVNRHLVLLDPETLPKIVHP